MPLCKVDYICLDCGEKASDDYPFMICQFCGGHLKGHGGPSVTGTRDNFGIKKSFIDDETGEDIDNWKSWERHGYRNPVEVTRNNTVKEKIKRKIDKIKHERK